jgi:hypothetical protein
MSLAMRTISGASLGARRARPSLSATEDLADPVQATS